MSTLKRYLITYQYKCDRFDSFNFLNIFRIQLLARIKCYIAISSTIAKMYDNCERKRKYLNIPLFPHLPSLSPRGARVQLRDDSSGLFP